MTVLAQPTNPGQACAITGSSGTVAGAAVTTVTVSCTNLPEPQLAR